MFSTRFAPKDLPMTISLSNVRSPAVAQPLAKAATAAPVLPFALRNKLEGLEVYYKGPNGKWVLLTAATKLKVGTTYEFFAVYNRRGKPKSPQVSTEDELGRWSVKWGVPVKNKDPRDPGRTLVFIDSWKTQVIKLWMGPPATGKSSWTLAAKVHGVAAEGSFLTTRATLLRKAGLDPKQEWVVRAVPTDNTGAFQYLPFWKDHKLWDARPQVTFKPDMADEPFSLPRNTALMFTKSGLETTYLVSSGRLGYYGGSLWPVPIGVNKWRAYAGGPELDHIGLKRR